MDPRFATVEINEQAGIPDVGLRGVKFRLDGECTFADYMNGGPRTLLIWPDGHVRYDADTGTVWLLNLDHRGVAEFTSDDILDIWATFGYVPLFSLDFVNPPDPSCDGGPDQRVALVTVVAVHI